MTNHYKIKEQFHTGNSFKAKLNYGSVCMQVLAFMLNTNIESCQFPEKSKVVRITLILKKGDRICKETTILFLYAPFTLLRKALPIYSKGISSDKRCLNNDLKHLNVWMQGNELSLNVLKAQSMLVYAKIKQQNLTTQFEFLLRH